MESAREIGTLIQALYETICGPAGQPRHWDDMRRLFFPGAHMIRTIVDPKGIPQAQVMDVDTYIKTTNSYFDHEGFYEWEIAQRVDRFGNIAQVFSTGISSPPMF